jgi:hypothetical protein
MACAIEPIVRPGCDRAIDLGLARPSEKWAHRSHQLDGGGAPDHRRVRILVMWLTFAKTDDGASQSAGDPLDDVAVSHRDPHEGEARA